MRRDCTSTAAFLVAAAFLLAAGSALVPDGCARAWPEPLAGKPAMWSQEAGTFTLEVFDPPLRAFVQPPPTVDAAKQAELVITLHGHGGTASSQLDYMAPIAAKRGAYCMACEGSGTEKSGGHSWSQADTGGILACLDAVLAKFSIDPKRVLVTGHSAGGTMAFATYAVRPAAFAGIYTTAAPASPTTQHKGARVVVNLGTRDGNYAGSFEPSVEASKNTVVGRIIAVEDLAHDFPHELYSEEAVAWLLDSKAPSEVLRVPGSPNDAIEAPDSATKGGAFRHVLVFEAGGRGAPADAPKRAAAKAKATKLMAKALAAGKGTAGNAFDAIAAENEDPLARASRGVITGAVVARYGAALRKGMATLGAGDVSDPVESDAGWHVVLRDP